MRYQSLKRISGCLVAAAIVLAGVSLHAESQSDFLVPDEIYNEMQGIDTFTPDAGQAVVPEDRPVQRLNPAALLLIPDSDNDRVMSFDPTTGDIVDENFIPPDPDHLSTPLHAILSADGMSILVSDQIEDVVQEYDLEGNYIGIFAPAGGPDPSILDNIRGMAMLPGGNLLVTVGSGTNADAVAEFDTEGNYLGNFIANGDGGLDSPFDVYIRPTDVLVGGITSDAIHRYDSNGMFLDLFTLIDAFPEQIAEAADSNVLVANFSGLDEGVVEYLPDGSLLGIYNPPEVGGNRGVYELPNGNILTTNGDGVYEISRDGSLVETKMSNVSARYIELVDIVQVDLSVEILPLNGTVFQPGDFVQYQATVMNLTPDPIQVTGEIFATNVPGFQVTLHGPITFTLAGDASVSVNLETQIPFKAPPLTVYICADANGIQDCYSITIE